MVLLYLLGKSVPVSATSGLRDQIPFGRHLKTGDRDIALQCNSRVQNLTKILHIHKGCEQSACFLGGNGERFLGEPELEYFVSLVNLKLLNNLSSQWSLAE